MYFNLARMLTATTGTGNVTLSTAVPGCKTFADAGAVDSGEYEYAITTYDLSTHRPIRSETGIGKYISSGTIFQRNTIESSTDSDNSAIDLTGLSEIFLAPIASSFNTGFNPMALAFQNGNEIFASGAYNKVSINTIESDEGNLISLSSDSDPGNILLANVPGYYKTYVRVEISADSDFVSTDYIGIEVNNEGPDYNITSSLNLNAGNYSHVFQISQMIYLDAENFVKVFIRNNTAKSITLFLSEISVVYFYAPNPYP